MSESEQPPQPPRPTEPEFQKPEPPKSTRRSFLQRAAAALGYGILGGATIDAVGYAALKTAQALQPEPLWQRVPAESAEHLDIAGLGDYEAAYLEMERYKNIFGDEFMAWGEDMQFPAIPWLSRTLSAAASGAKHVQLKNSFNNVDGVSFFRDGWGTQKDQALPNAVQKVEDITRTSSLLPSSNKTIVS